jgi:hypothetical protein
VKWACHAGLLPAVGRNDQQSVITFHRLRDTGQVPADCLAELQIVTLQLQESLLDSLYLPDYELERLTLKMLRMLRQTFMA